MNTHTNLIWLLLLLGGCASMMSNPSSKTKNFIVSPEGKASNKGTLNSPTTLGSAIRSASEYLKSNSSTKGVHITLQEGVYHYTKAFSLGSEFSGTASDPILIQAAKGAKVVFDGRVNVANPETFSKITEEEELLRVPKSAREKIVVKTIFDSALIELLKSKLVISLGVDEQQYLPSVFPNSGFAMLDTNPTVKENYPPGLPKERQAYGMRAGQPPFVAAEQKAGWLGTLTDPQGAEAGIVRRADEMAGTWQQWSDELERDNTRNEFTGFYEAIWKLSSMPLHSVNPKQKTLRLPKVFSYGFGWLKTQPFRVFGLLCELDQPGEWYFDTKTNRLYLYPVQPILKDTRIGLPVADGFLNLKNCNHVTVTGIDVVNVGRGTLFNIEGGTHNLIASCSMKNSTATGASITGNYNEMKGCDFVDLNAHAKLSGGHRSPTEIVSAHNSIENCHFYNKNFKHEKVNISINGVGNTFRNNLIHNSIGQAVVVNGNEHAIEMNELFNIGYEEGDGGAMYSGADVIGYGNLYRFNFFHHLMRTPEKKLGRNGLFLDDFQAGATCIGNIFYKSCTNGICMNQGAGHTLIGNIFLATDNGIYQRGNWGEKALKITNGIAADPNHNYKGLKEDYIGRAEKEIGKKGWLTEPWASKYPLMKKVLSDEKQFGRLWPIGCTFEQNIFFENRRDLYLYRCPEEVKAKMNIDKGIQVDKSAFVDYDSMNYTLAKPIEGVEKIPFDNIGLYLDEYRKEMPDKQHYRMALKKCFDGIESYKACHKTLNTATIVEEGPIVH